MAGDKQKAKSYERHTIKDKVKVEIEAGRQTINQIPPLEKKKTKTPKVKTEKSRAAREKINQKDPVVASYDVFLKPRLRGGKRLYVFQYPNRDVAHPYSTACNNMPLEIRLKKNSGLVEVDVPIDTSRDYDREKGVKWGDAIQKTNPSKGSGGVGVGLAAGFGVGATQPARLRGSRRDQGQEDIMQEDLMRDWTASVVQEKVLAKQTLGGQILPKDPTKPRYLIGVFRENQLHLTAADGIIQLRPQFHHIDAQGEVERLGRPREPGLTRATEPRAIHMTIKSTADGEEDSSDTIADRLRAVQEEPWKCFVYNDEESFEAWDAYSQHLFVQDTEYAPKLVSSMNKRQLLDVITPPAALQKIQEVRKLKAEEQKKAEKRKNAIRTKLKKKREAEVTKLAKKAEEHEIAASQRRNSGMGAFLDRTNDQEEEEKEGVVEEAEGKDGEHGDSDEELYT